MSDRAATEKSFQQLLQDYRTTLLKENMDNFNELSEPDQLLITKMNNFFCGLHLLVNIADLMCSIFKEWEQTVMNKEVVGESAIIKTVREVCKAFVPVVDNKNGASLELKTYLSRINVKFQLKPFQEGNTNTLNGLMKDVLRNLKCSQNIVGLRALGVYNKFITSPLWKIIEADNTHILDMNAHYQNLIQIFRRCCYKYRISKRTLNW
ncbi:uncharacterized protein LOC127725962 [Mytilus californianus]|uniref:uncharacterized protein LOC127725962 n=1 Tax=Mytilus californianus TaxID=6549 RepID=UPI0022468188|nr:uncharacterized protein LOC127725962 [Mytilus californianus]